MHGLVVLDRSDEVIRPAILWNDQRTGEECAEIEQRVGLERLIELTGNRALTGFTAPKLLWLRRHEPDAYARIRRVLLPKDYVRLRLTGEWGIDASDASGTLLLDVARRDWSADVLDALDLPREWLPPVFESPDLVGETTASGIVPHGISVAAGAGDQPAAALGVGVDRPGALSVVLGTSGVVLAALPAYAHDREARVHAFCHAVPQTWQAMGVMLSAAGSLQWLHDVVAPGYSVREARRRGGGMAARGRWSAVRAVPRRRADAVRRPRRSRRVRRPRVAPRPRGARPGRPRRRRLRPARLARAPARAGRGRARRPRVGRRLALCPVAADRGVRAWRPARVDRVVGGVGARGGDARRCRRRRVRRHVGRSRPVRAHRRADGARPCLGRCVRAAYGRFRLLYPATKGVIG